jgi:HSP20 family protein
LRASGGERCPQIGHRQIGALETARPEHSFGRVINCGRMRTACLNGGSTMNALSSPIRRHASVAQGGTRRAAPFDDLLNQVFGDLRLAQGFASHDWPHIDVQENETEFRVSVDLPGVTQDNIELGFQDDMLTLKARRETAGSGSALYSTRWNGSVERVVAIGPDVDADRISASLKNGVLTISLPKKPERQPRRIQID